MDIRYTLQNLWETKRKTMLGIGFLLILVLILGLVYLLIPRPSIGGNSVVVPTDPVELTWWKPDLNGMKKSNYQKLIADFQTLHPNVKINLVNKPYGESYYTSIIESMALGVGPDIFSLHSNDLPAYQNYLTPVSVFQGVDASGAGRLANYRSSFVDLVVRDSMIQGEVYGVASSVDNIQMYVNRDLLNQASIALPAQTWSDIDVQIPKLTKKNSTGTGFDQSAISLGTGNISGTVPNINRNQDILPLLIFQFGNQIYDPITKQSVLAQTSGRSNPSLEAVNFYYSFANPDSGRYTWSVNSPNNIEAFTSGKLAYILHYSYFANEIASRNPRMNYEVVRVPQINSSAKKTYGFFFMDVLNRNLKDKPENSSKLYWAEQFLLYLSGTQAQSELAASTGFASARKDVISEQLKGDIAQQVFAEGALYATNYYKPDVERTEAIWPEMMFDIHYQSETKAEGALSDAAREYQRLVLDGPQRR